MSVKPIPDGYHSVTPYLIVDGAAEAIRWYGEALGATEVLRLPMGDKIAHAEIRIGDSHVMLSDEWPDHGKLGPKARGGATSTAGGRPWCSATVPTPRRSRPCRRNGAMSSPDAAA